MNVAESSAQDLVTYSDGKLTTPEGIISFTSSSEDMSLDGSKAITIYSIIKIRLM
ncbi:hypothetical protein SNF32_06910 [Enterococcus mundtii]|nr:hypothetical protein [Enterococcus mundtii]